MPWFKVDDSFHGHPKVLATEPAALGLWVIAGAWSSAHLTDGFVPTHALTRLLPGSDEFARALVTAGLWRRAKGGYQFHDWSEYQPSKDDVDAERKAARERMRKLRLERRGAAQPQDGSPEQKPNVRANFGGSSATPTRPDPLKNNIKNSSSPAAPPTEPPLPKPGSDDDPLFTRFWAAYPRKIGKGQARKAWAKVIKTTDPEAVIAAAGHFTALRGHEDPQFIPHPTTWLNGERWGDVPDPEPRPAGPVMPWDLWS
jgi:hypothetical protein